MAFVYSNVELILLEMKKLIYLVAVMVIGANLFAQTGQVEVTVIGVKVKKGGEVVIGLFEKDGFPLVGKEISGKEVKVTNYKITATIKDIPAGIYAIAVFQDENTDGNLNTKLFGIPSEPYGFSQNKYGSFGPPDFKEVSFKIVNGEKFSLTINLK